MKALTFGMQRGMCAFKCGQIPVRNIFLNAVRIIKKAKELKIPYVAVGGGRNELPVPKEGSSWLSMQLEFCAKHLKLSSSN